MTEKQENYVELFLIIVKTKLETLNSLTVHDAEKCFINYALKSLNAESDPETKSH